MPGESRTTIKISRKINASARSLKNGRIFISEGGIPMCIPIVDLKRTGQNISVLREKQGISVKELQQILGFATPQAIYKWQRGICLPTVDNLVVLSVIFSVPVDDILAVEMKGCGKNAASELVG